MTAIAPVERVSDVQPHPASDKLDIVTIASKVNVANRPEPGVPRYKVGDYAVVLQENLILPEEVLRRLELWDEAKNKGLLAGSRGNRTKARRIAGVMSEVALIKVFIKQVDDVTMICFADDGELEEPTLEESLLVIPAGMSPEGVNVAISLDIEPYEPGA